MRKIFKFIGIIVLILIIVLVAKTIFYSSKQIDVESENAIEISDKSIQNLGKAVSFRTISY
jgi:uncharacterized protein YpmB